MIGLTYVWQKEKVKMDGFIEMKQNVLDLASFQF